MEEVDAGEEAPRTVVSGLVKYIPEAEMQGRRVVLVCNLKPANMRGIQSQAMVLAATAPDGSKVWCLLWVLGARPACCVAAHATAASHQMWLVLPCRPRPGSPCLPYPACLPSST